MMSGGDAGARSASFGRAGVERWVQLAGALMCLSAVACGGAVQQAKAPEKNGQRPGAEKEAAILACIGEGAPRTDYQTVADYRCQDGSQPLDHDAERAARSRRGNVGPGPDGHIVDVYEVPCRSGKIDVYVDGYHCNGKPAPVSTSDELSSEQLQKVARAAHAIADAPFERKAADFREQLFAFFQSTDQVTIVACAGPFSAAVHPDYEHSQLLFKQFIVSLGAATIEQGHGAPLAPIYESALSDVLRTYDAIVRERGKAATDPEIVQALAARSAGALREFVEQKMAGECDNKAAP